MTLAAAGAVLTGLLAGSAAAAATSVRVYSTGLFNPKGMAFGLDGALYVAESGPPGNVKVPLPVNFGGSGPIGTRAAVARIPAGGGPAKPFVSGLPNIGLYGGVEMLGAGSVTLFKGQLYEVAAGHMTVSPKLSRITPDGKLVTVADVGRFNDEHPPPEQNGDAVPMGNPFDLVGVGDHLFISDGNYNSIIEADPATGKLELLHYFRPDPTTVGMAIGPDGNIYVAQYGNAPYLPGSGSIDKVTPDGKVTPNVVKGLTTPVDVAFGPDGTMYVLQYAAKFDAAKKRYVENTGGLFRIDKQGGKHALVEHMMFPTALAFGKDGALYATNFGNESNQGQGQVLRIVPGDTAVESPAVPKPTVHGTYDVPKSNKTFVGTIAGAAKLSIVEPPQVLKWGFSPKTIRAKVGQKIVVTNTGRISHTMTSVTGAFDTGLIAQGRSAVVTLEKPGVYKFVCTPHPWMKGTLIVSGAAKAAGGGKGGGIIRLHSPSLNAGVVAGVVALIIVGVFGLAWLARRRPEAG